MILINLDWCWLVRIDPREEMERLRWNGERMRKWRENEEIADSIYGILTYTFWGNNSESKRYIWSGGKAHVIAIWRLSSSSKSLLPWWASSSPSSSWWPRTAARLHLYSSSRTQLDTWAGQHGGHEQWAGHYEGWYEGGGRCSSAWTDCNIRRRTCGLVSSDWFHLVCIKNDLIAGSDNPEVTGLVTGWTLLATIV